MGMFDQYEPDPVLYCPVCGDELSGWQGKDGPCALLVWRQGSERAVDQFIDDERRLSEEERSQFRLPPAFRIYTDDEHDHWIEARCTSRDGVWSSIEIVEVRELWTRKLLPLRPAG